jgi:hypothetical protein
VVIEAKLTSDDGTARDKVARIKNLETQRNQHVARIDGRGFRERCEDMRQMLSTGKIKWQGIHPGNPGSVDHRYPEICQRGQLKGSSQFTTGISKSQFAYSFYQQDPWKKRSIVNLTTRLFFNNA